MSNVLSTCLNFRECPWWETDVQQTVVLCVGNSLTVILSQNFHQRKKTILLTCPYIDKSSPGSINTIHVFHNHATCCLQKQQHSSGITFSEASVLGLPKTSMTWKSLHNDITHQNNVRSTYGTTGWKPYQLPTFTVQILHAGLCY